MDTYRHTPSRLATSAVAQLGTRLSALNESMRGDFSGVINGVSNTTYAICDKIEEHETAMATELREKRRF